MDAVLKCFRLVLGPLAGSVGPVPAGRELVAVTFAIRGRDSRLSLRERTALNVLSQSERRQGDCHWAGARGAGCDWWNGSPEVVVFRDFRPAGLGCLWCRVGEGGFAD